MMKAIFHHYKYSTLFWRNKEWCFFSIVFGYTMIKIYDLRKRKIGVNFAITKTERDEK